MISYNFNKFDGIQPATREALNWLYENSGLPLIKGKWFFVDPYNGSATGGGEADSPVNNLSLAYDLCTTGNGDGIIVLSGGTVSADTTSYLSQQITWSKHGITVVGVAAPVSMFGRARIANKTITTGSIETISFTNSGTSDYISDSAGGFLTAGFAVGQKVSVNSTSNTNDGAYTISAITATKMTLSASDSLTTEDAATAGATVIVSYNTNLITLSGSNNTFVNLSFFNDGTNALEIGGIVVSGDRNFFGGCHIVGGAGAATTANNNSLTLTGSENTFRECAIGSSTFAQGDNAAAEIILSGTVKRNKFYDCEIVAMVSAGTAHGAVKSVGTSGGAGTVFKNCLFNYALSTTTPAAAHLVSGASDEVIFMDCAACQVTAWGTSVYANMVAPAATAGGGLMTTA
jgi:hypothetical protein